MKGTKLLTKKSRRQFLVETISASAMMMGCKVVFGKDELDLINQEVARKYRADSGMTYEQVFNFAFKNWYIRYMKGIEDQIGKKETLALLRKVGWALYEESTKNNFRDIQNRDVESLITNFWEPMGRSKLWSHTIPVEIVKKSASEGIVKMPQCLVAKTFRDADAADIGYAAICHADFAVAHAFNPRIKLTRNKCIMNGDAYCYFEYSLES